jgi:Ca2+-binding EF-hand superfamily protein
LTISDLQARKLDRAFDHFDIDRDEQIERGDFAELGARFLLGFGHQEGTGRGRDLIDHFDQIWWALATQLDTDEGGSLSRQEFRSGMDAAFISGNKFPQILRPAARAVIRLADTDGDGLISLPEFTVLQQAYGTPAGAIREAFEMIDANGDGQLSTAELEQAMHDFYVGRKPTAPGNWLFGPV